MLQSTTLRAAPEPDGVRVRLARRAAHVLDRDRDSGDALPPLELRDRAAQGRVAEWARRDEVRLDEREQRADRDEHGGAGDPPDLAEPPCQEHHDEERDAERDEGAAELEPVPEGPVEVAGLREAVAACPPDVEEPERQLHEPDDPEPEHAEQHPRADRPGRGLAGEPRAAARVDPERGEEGDLHQHPVDEEEALDPDGVLHDLLPKIASVSTCARCSPDGTDVRRSSEAHATQAAATSAPARIRTVRLSRARFRPGRTVRARHGRRLQLELELLVVWTVAHRRPGVGIAIGEQEEVCVHLAGVPQADGAEVANALRHAPGEERGPPAEQRDDVERRRSRPRRAAAPGSRARSGTA